jgi:hypothetical protein
MSTTVAYTSDAHELNQILAVQTHLAGFGGGLFEQIQLERACGRVDPQVDKQCIHFCSSRGGRLHGLQ